MVVPRSGETCKHARASAVAAIVKLAQVYCKFCRTGRMQSSDSDSSAGTSSISTKSKQKSSRFSICMQTSPNSGKSYSTSNHKGTRHFRKTANSLSKRSLQCPYHQRLTSRKELRSKLKKSYWTRHTWGIGALTKEYCKLLQLLVNWLLEALIEKVSWEAMLIMLIKGISWGKIHNLGNSTSLTNTIEVETRLLHQLQPWGQHLIPHCTDLARDKIVVEPQSHHKVRNLVRK